MSELYYYYYVISNPNFAKPAALLPHGLRHAIGDGAPKILEANVRIAGDNISFEPKALCVCPLLYGSCSDDAGPTFHYP